MTAEVTKSSCVIMKPGKLSPLKKRNGIFSSKKIELRKKQGLLFI